MNGLLIFVLGIASLMVPTFLARRGIGSRWIWFGGGIAGLVVLLLLLAFFFPLIAEAPGKESFDPKGVPFAAFPMAVVSRLCFLLILGFVFAGIAYRPKQEPGILGK
jgi:hypothetical protein